MTNETVPALRKPSYLLETHQFDPDRLVADARGRPYHSLDPETPTCRFRGTLVKQCSDGFRVVGWQRNIARLQKTDVSYLMIITMELDEARRIRSVALDPCFKGSKGLLCHHAYLDENLRSALSGVTVDEQFFKRIQVGELQCFHLVEVVGGILSCLETLDQRTLSVLAEDEVMDAYAVGKNLVITGAQRMSHTVEETCFALVVHGAFDHIRFDAKGTMYANEPFPVDVYIDDQHILRTEVAGKRATSMCQEIKTLALEALGRVKPTFVEPANEHSFMCSNLFPQAFIGLLVQIVSMKLYYNNLNYVLHCLKGLQRFRDVPRCVGAVESVEEAVKYFPRFDVAAVF